MEQDYLGIINKELLRLSLVNNQVLSRKTTYLGVPTHLVPTYRLSVSSNIGEVIRSVLNFLFFFTIRFHKYKKAPKSIKKHLSGKKELFYDKIS